MKICNFEMMIRMLFLASIILCLSSIHSEAFTFVDRVIMHRPRRRSLDHRPLLKQTTQAKVSASSYDRWYHSSPYCHRTSFFSCASSKSNNNNNDDEHVVTNDDDLLVPHYTTKSILSWLRKMADSYQIERGEDLLDVILRESNNSAVNNDIINSINIKDYSKNDDNDNDDDKTMYLLKLAKACAKTNLPIASHDFLRDETGEAIYNYGNIAFLHGFGYEWDEFIQLPSRKCVETDGEVEERQRLLNDVKKNAMMVQQQQQKQQKQEQRQSNNDNTNSTTIAGDDLSSSKYDNLIRVRKDGRKILLRGVNLWNVYDTTIQGTHDTLESIRSKIERGEITIIGQAVWIRHVEYLD